MQPEDNEPLVRAHWCLTRLERKQIGAQLWEEVTMATGGTKNFRVSGPAIPKLWKEIKANFANGILTSSPLKVKRHYPLLYCRADIIIMQEIRNIPHCKRQTLRDMAYEFGVGKSTL
jgi:hypothetical protein